MIGDTSPLGRCAKEAEALSGFAVTVNKVEWDKTGGIRRNPTAHQLTDTVANLRRRTTGCDGRANIRCVPTLVKRIVEFR